MKKSVLFLLGLGMSGFAFSQNIEKQKQEFAKQNLENQIKFEKFIQANKSKFSQEEIEDLKSRLAGFAGEIPVFLSSDDRPANRSAGMTQLKDGTLPGLNSQIINGMGINFVIMDGGTVHNTHQEFGGTVNGPLRVVNKEDVSTVTKSAHATNVTGIILAAGGRAGTINWSDGSSNPVADAEGVLTKASSENYAFATTALGTNYEKLTNATNANISNHSYGINLGWAYRTTPTEGWYWVANYQLNGQDTYSGSYYTNDQNFDKVVYTNPNHIVVKSAGNYYGYGPDGSLPNFKYNNTTGTYVPFAPTDVLPPPNCSQGYNCIGWGSLAKNIIVVGATDQLTTTNNLYTNSTDVNKASFSSAGPRKDGAIKPDISAVGVNIVSPTYSSSAPTAINYYSKGAGTSYSAPIVSGVAGAVTQVNRIVTGNSTFTYKADEMKALLTHTANEAGNPGPDVWYGWGFVDAKKAAELVINKFNNAVTFERNLKTSGVTYSKTVVAKGTEPLKATISWVDPAATPFTNDSDLQNNRASRLINDFDLRIVDITTNEVFYPWKLNALDPMANATKGDNTVDNVEQILISAPIAGRSYRIDVTNKGTLVNDNNLATPQNYALIITGYQFNLSTSETDTNKLISLYPAVTKDFVNILIPKNAKSIEIYDASGKQVMNFKAKDFNTIDVSSFVKGVYIVNIKTSDTTVSKKFIKE